MRWPIIIRRTVGRSMKPTLLPNSLVLATGLYRRIAKDDLVIFEHSGIDKIKRVKDIGNDRVYVLGDNDQESTDSRVFGWIPSSSIKAKVIWPRKR
jgi:signal peptidase I